LIWRGGSRVGRVARFCHGLHDNAVRPGQDPPAVGVRGLWINEIGRAQAGLARIIVRAALPLDVEDGS